MRRLAGLLAPRELDAGGGLPWVALYPSGPGAVGIRPRNPGGHRSIPADTSSTVLLAANARRVAATIDNDSTAILYVSHGPFASSSSYTVRVRPGGTYILESPDCYQGDVAGAWASATGSAQVTENTDGQ